MIVTLYHRQSIRCHVLVRYEPWLSVTFFSSANAQPLPLTDGIVHKTCVPTQGSALGGPYLSRLMRQIAIEKFTEWTLTDKANSCAVFLGEIRQAMFPRDSAHLTFV